MKATIEMVPVSRLVSSSHGSAAVVEFSDNHFIGTIHRSLGRWYLKCADGDIIPMDPEDNVGLFSGLKVS